MDKLIIQLIHIKLLWRCSDISWLIPISFNYSINGCYQQVMSNIKFSAIIEEGFKIFLNNISFELTIFMKLFIFHQPLYLTCRRHTNAITTIGILSRFYNPYTLFFLKLLLLELFNSYALLISRNDVVCMWKINEWIDFHDLGIVPMH